jgi:hypothetical protein
MEAGVDSYIMADLSPNPSPTRRGELDFSPFHTRKEDWGLDVCDFTIQPLPKADNY